MVSLILGLGCLSILPPVLHDQEALQVGERPRPSRACLPPFDIIADPNQQAS